jgi:DNA-binding response OmpR family regulator
LLGEKEYFRLYKDIPPPPVSSESKHSIILVEDNIKIRDLLAGYFALAKYNTYEASSSNECLEIINRLYGKVDVVLVNGNIAADMSPMLIVNIKKLNPTIKVFTISENESYKTRVLDYGADDFAVQPISPTTIVEKTSLLLMKKPAGSV